MKILSRFFEAFRKPMPESEVLETLAALTAQMTDYEDTLKAQRQALWRIEKRVDKYLGKENGGDEGSRQAIVETEPVLRAGEPTKNIW